MLVDLQVESVAIIMDVEAKMTLSCCFSCFDFSLVYFYSCFQRRAKWQSSKWKWTCSLYLRKGGKCQRCWFFCFLLAD